MIRARFVLCSVAVAALALTACKKEGGEVTKEAGAALNYLPKDTKVVFGMNFSSLASAKILEKYKAELMKTAPPEFKELQAACNIDIFKDLKSVVAGVAGENKAVLVISGNFKKDQIEDCAKKAAEKEGKTFEATDDGKMRVYSTGAEKMYAYWAGEGTVVATSDDSGGAAALKAVLDGEKLGEGDVMTMVKATKTSAGIWAAGQLDDSMTGGMPVGGEVSGFAATVEASDTLDIKAMAKFNSAEKASEAASQAKMMMGLAESQPMAKPFLPIIQKVKIEADGVALKVGVSLTSEDLDKLQALQGMMQ